MSHHEYPPLYRNYVLFLLVIVYAFNYIDRQLMTILLEPIKQEFGVSDTAMGFLTGFAFALFYATLGVPVARLADNWSRRNVLTIALALWSGLTALCGAAANFSQMALLRIGVGVGEAGGTPPSHSLIADYFPPEKRSSALGVHAIGTQIGILVGMFGGATIADAFGWRMAFVVFGLPGVLLAIIVGLTIKEPAKPEAAAIDDGGLLRAVGTIWRIPAFSLIAIAASMVALSSIGMASWTPSFLIRVHGLSLVEAGLILGICGVIAGTSGAFVGGLLCDRLSVIDKRWQLWVPACGAFLSIPLQTAFLLWPEDAYWMLNGIQVPAAVPFTLLGGFFSTFWVGPTFAAVQNIAPSHLRTQASALMLLVFNLVGMGLGPLIVGMLSDGLAPEFGEYSIRYAMLASQVVVLVGTYVYYKAATPYRTGK